MHATFRVAPAGPSVASLVPRPTHATYVRRRLVALVFLVTLVLSFGLAARHGLADRGDGPASVSTAGRASLAGMPGVLADGTYVVQPGDSLWSIAERVSAHLGAATGTAVDVASYVEAMVALHGGVTIAPGERLRMP